MMSAVITVTMVTVCYFSKTQMETIIVCEITASGPHAYEQLLVIQYYYFS